jgi:2-polyprenyl-6-methoxyphenol hydroxylase-like FAD-dependent oxidoreductase
LSALRHVDQTPPVIRARPRDEGRATHHPDRREPIMSRRTQPREYAVVIGASMGGLVTAAALAPHFGRVTVLERDALPSAPAHRRGVPQSKHAHGLQPGGLRALESLLPGITDDLVAGGAPTGDQCQDASWYVGGGRLARSVAGYRAIGLTRPYLEHRVREHVRALPNVVIRDCFDVTGLVAAEHRGSVEVRGVVGSPEPGTTVELRADLVVDASGRRSALPDWLRSLGCAVPAEEQVHCRMAYLTRRWRLANDVMGEDVVAVVAPADTPSFGVIIAQEDGSHIVTLGGLLDGAPAKDDDAYLAFASSLPDARIADALAGAEPVTDYQPSRFPFSRRRRYDKLRSFPSGLLALGDSIASFNPMYGQGMSVAAREAVLLRDSLAKGALNTRAFFKAAHRIEDVAWKISTGGDLRFDAIEGARTPDMRVMNAYLDRLAVAARHDPVVAEAFLSVAGFMAGPQTLFKPAVLRRALRGARAARRSGEPAVVTIAPRDVTEGATAGANVTSGAAAQVRAAR